MFLEIHFKVTACASVPQLPRLCDIRNTTLINYWWHDDYGNDHQLIISHNLFQISVHGLQQKLKFYQKCFGMALPRKLLPKALQPCWASSAAHEWKRWKTISCGLRQSRVVRRSLGYPILIEVSAKHINLRTNRCAKCKISF